MCIRDRNSIVHMQYEGFVQVTYELFEKTEKDSDHVITMGKNEVFPELEKKFLGMCEGEEATVTLPPESAFFDDGHSELKIAPYTTLVFEVKITKVEQPKDEL